MLGRNECKTRVDLGNCGPQLREIGTGVTGVHRILAEETHQKLKIFTKKS